jgi:hypothetical protein
MNWNDSYQAALAVYMGLNLFSLALFGVVAVNLVRTSKRMEEQIEAIFEELDE